MHSSGLSMRVESASVVKTIRPRSVRYLSMLALGEWTEPVR
jgi:hypothetical protein